MSDTVADTSVDTSFPVSPTCPPELCRYRPVYAEILEKVGHNAFHGYDATQLDDAKVVAILDGDKQLDALGHGYAGQYRSRQHSFFTQSPAGKSATPGSLYRPMCRRQYLTLIHRSLA